MLQHIRKLTRNLLTKKQTTEEQATEDEVITEWSKCPERYFRGQHGLELEWSTSFGFERAMGLLPTHGHSKMPPIKCVYSERDQSYTFGWIERISMHGGGVVRIGHFGLNNCQINFERNFDLTHKGLGLLFFEAILRFFKKHNGIIIEFHEDHGSKIEHYWRFFDKAGVKEVERGVWVVDLYKDNELPAAVKMFHKSLERERKTILSN